MIKTNAGELPWIPKGWGGEKIIENNEKYCGKLLLFIKGKKCSLHTHFEKQESFYIHSGKIWVFWSDDFDHIKKLVDEAENGYYGNESFKTKDITTFLEKTLLEQGDVFHVPQKRLHMMLAVEDTELFEFSTHHEDKDSEKLVRGD